MVQDFAAQEEAAFRDEVEQVKQWWKVSTSTS